MHSQGDAWAENWYLHCGQFPVSKNGFDSSIRHCCSRVSRDRGDWGYRVSSEQLAIAFRFLLLCLLDLVALCALLPVLLLVLALFVLLGRQHLLPIQQF